jgi:molybdopterin synthase sulfur carrier subunit
MPQITFTPTLQRHVKVPPREVEGGTVREVLDRIFAEAPMARGYVLDEQGALRKHVTVFVDGETVLDRSVSRCDLNRMAEGVGFEPTGRVNDRRFSRPLL